MYYVVTNSGFYLRIEKGVLVFPYYTKPQALT